MIGVEKGKRERSLLGEKRMGDGNYGLGKAELRAGEDPGEKGIGGGQIPQEDP